MVGDCNTRKQWGIALLLAILAGSFSYEIPPVQAQPNVTDPQTAASITSSIDTLPQSALPLEARGIPSAELSIGAQVWQLHQLAGDFFTRDPVSFDATMTFITPVDVWIGIVLHNGTPVTTISIKPGTSNSSDWFVANALGPEVGINIAAEYQAGDKLLSADPQELGMYLLRGLDLVGVDSDSATACPAPCTMSQFWNVYNDPLIAQATQMASLSPLTQDQVSTAEIEGANAATLEAAGFKVETPSAFLSDSEKPDVALNLEDGPLGGRNALLSLGGVVILVLLMALVVGNGKRAPRPPK